MKDTLTKALTSIVAVNAPPTISDMIPVTDDTVSLISTFIIAIISIWKLIKKPKPQK